MKGCSHYKVVLRAASYCVEDLFLDVGLLDLLLVNKKVLPDDLHGIEFVSALFDVAHEVDLAIGPLPDALERLEVIKGSMLLSQLAIECARAAARHQYLIIDAFDLFELFL